MCDRINVELSHCACRAFDRAYRAGLVEEVREVGDVHVKAAEYPPWKAVETGRSVGALVSVSQRVGGERQNRRSGCGEHDRLGWPQPRAGGQRPGGPGLRRVSSVTDTLIHGIAMTSSKAHLSSPST